MSSKPKADTEHLVFRISVFDKFRHSVGGVRGFVSRHHKPVHHDSTASQKLCLFFLQKCWSHIVAV